MRILCRIKLWLRDIAYRNRVYVARGNKVEISESAHAVMKKTTIKVRGRGNRLLIADQASISNCEIRLYGDNNSIEIGPRVRFKSGKIYLLETSGQHIRLGADTTVEGAYLLVDEAASIDLGKDCMLSTEIIIRTGDKHSILDAQTQQRINPAKDVVIADRVWVGRAVHILKGTRLQRETVVGACSVVSGSFNEENCIVAGVPARIVKRGIRWDRDLL